MRIAVLALLPACALYYNDDQAPGDDDGSATGSATTAAPGNYNLVVTRTMGGAHRIVGVDSDHAGGVWIAYQEYSSVDLIIDHVDAAGDVASEWTYDDDPSEVSGLAFTGTDLWVSYNAIGSIGENRVRELDAATGATVQSFATPGQIADLELQNGLLLLSSYQNEVIAIDPATGGEQWQMVTQVIPSTQKGVAAYRDKLFVSSWDMATLTLMDDGGDILGSASSSLLHANETSSVGLFLAADGPDGLIYASDSQIAWLSVTPSA